MYSKIKVVDDHLVLIESERFLLFDAISIGDFHHLFCSYSYRTTGLNRKDREWMNITIQEIAQAVGSHHESTQSITGVEFDSRKIKEGDLFVPLAGTRDGHDYEIDTEIPMDNRVIKKFTTQNKGSVTHQFLLMSLLLVTARWLDEPVSVLLQLTGSLSVPKAMIQLLVYVKWINVSVLILGVIAVYLLWRKEHAKNIH